MHSNGGAYLGISPNYTDGRRCDRKGCRSLFAPRVGWEAASEGPSGLVRERLTRACVDAQLPALDRSIAGLRGGLSGLLGRAGARVAGGSGREPLCCTCVPPTPPHLGPCPSAQVPTAAASLHCSATTLALLQTRLSPAGL